MENHSDFSPWHHCKATRFAECLAMDYNDCRITHIYDTVSRRSKRENLEFVLDALKSWKEMTSLLELVLWKVAMMDQKAQAVKDRNDFCVNLWGRDCDSKCASFSLEKHQDMQ